MSDTPRKPSLADVVRRAMDARIADLRVCLPAKVTRYDAAKQQVDAQPLLADSIDGEDGAAVAVTLPVVTNVPVVFPGGGGFMLTFPIAAGDVVTLVFSDRSLDEWLSKGGDVTPADPRQHHLSDAVAFPSLAPFSAPRAHASASKVVLGKDGDPAIYIDGSEIHIGGDSGLEKAALGETLKTHLDSLKSTLDDLYAKFNAHTHTGTIASACTAGGAVGTCVVATPIGPATIPPAAVPTVTSAVVKVKT